MNETVFLIKILAECAFVMLANRLGKEWVVLTIVVNLILVSVLGAKVVTAFGLVTNAGNVFYAGVFLAIQLLVERYGRKEGWQAVRMGFGAIAFFLVMSSITQFQTSVGTSAPSVGADAAIATLFGFVPRIAFASVTAFLAAQVVNVMVYDDMRQRMGRRHLWLRSFMATVAGQLVDSVIFFYLAFSGVLPPDILLETLIVGFLVKTMVGVLCIPVLYASRPKIQQMI
jgi:uncharacterized integral membrane protein (TIGR00697 family)